MTDENRTSALVASILTTKPDLCTFNRSVVLRVRDHAIDMREDQQTRALRYVVLDEDIRGELETLRKFISEALAFGTEALAA